jgi:AcrR family transcriptional regulator
MMDTHEQKSGLILAAAERAFASYGYRQCSMELLAREAGLSRQGLYLHYSSKSELFGAVVERIQRQSLDDAMRAAEQARARGAGAVEILVAQISARAGSFLETLQDSPHAPELIEESARQCAQITEQCSRQFVADVTASIATEVAAGRLVLRDGLGDEKAGQLLVAAARGLKLAVPAPTQLEFRHDLGLLVSIFLG